MIVYFSGTGNSKYVAKRLSEITKEPLLCINERIKEKNFDPIVCGEKLIVVAPTYAWRLPRIATEYLEKVEIGAESAWFILTCGSEMAGAGKYNKALAEKKGWAYKGSLQVVMPENYIAMFNAPFPEEAKRIIHAAERGIGRGSKCIEKGEAFPKEKVNGLYRFMSSCINPIFYSLFVKDKAFACLDACTSCGLCESLCPMNNIALENGKPSWQGRCTHCMACMNYCPASAISYGKKSQKRYHYTLEKVLKE